MSRDGIQHSNIGIEQSNMESWSQMDDYMAQKFGQAARFDWQQVIGVSVVAASDG